MLTIPNDSKNLKPWFYVRKGFFQVFLPILLAFLTFCDFMSIDSPTKSYNHLYFYTSFILFLYASLRYFLEYIFSVCADDIIVRKEISLEKSTSELFLLDKETESNHYFVSIKKIFKLRYSNYKSFHYIYRLCYFLGIQCPILVPTEAITRLAGVRILDYDDDVALHTILHNLQNYRPKVCRLEIIDSELTTEEDRNLLNKPIITRIDHSICEMQKEIFNKEIENDLARVV